MWPRIRGRHSAQKLKEEKLDHEKEDEEEGRAKFRVSRTLEQSQQIARYLFCFASVPQISPDAATTRRTGLSPGAEARSNFSWRR